MKTSSPPSAVGTFFGLWLCVCLLLIGGLVFFALRFTAAVSLPQQDTVSLRGEPAPAQPATVSGAPFVPPAFNATASPYVITAFSLQGMRHITDAEPLWALLDTGSEFVVQVLERGATPEMRTTGITVRYQIQAGNTVQNDASLSGVCTPVEDSTYFQSPPIHLLPYTEDGGFAPYPIVAIEAVNDKGQVVASTKMVLPVSTEMGCRNCHKGAWKHSSAAGISQATAGDILAIHDRRNDTTLVRQAEGGQTVNCHSCHSGAEAPMNLSTAIHGFHATMKLPGADGCASCHPSSPNGFTRFQRDIHALWGLDCTRCHGVMEDHALSLLRGESLKGKEAATQRMAQITPRAVPSASEIHPRTPWVNLPDCTTCHDFVSKPQAATATAFNTWTASSDDLFSRRFENTGKIRCGSCHGAPHATYPATSPVGDERDNIQPLQYQGLAMPLGSDDNCAVCHKQPMDYPIHHDIIGK